MVVKRANLPVREILADIAISVVTVATWLGTVIRETETGYLKGRSCNPTDLRFPTGWITSEPDSEFRKPYATTAVQACKADR